MSSSAADLFPESRAATRKGFLREELDEALRPAHSQWQALRGSRIFLTGGTGFFGCWLLESFLRLNECLDLGAEMVVLTRDAAAFHARAPDLAAAPGITLHRGGDITEFLLPKGEFTHVIHAASELSSAQPKDPAGLIEKAVCGTRRVLDFARERGVRSLLFTSSGAVYGPAGSADRHLLREDEGAGALPLEPRWAYAEAKRAAEMIAVFLGRSAGIEVKIARGFAFFGPHLPLDSPLAAAGFIASALRGEQIVVQGHGQTVRSYLYGADLAAWLWTILLRGEAGRPYNVGSDVPVTIAELARTVATEAGLAEPPLILGKMKPNEIAESYVPAIARARQELGLEIGTSLSSAIHRTLRWHRQPNEN